MHWNTLLAGAAIALGLASAPAAAETIIMTSNRGPSVTIGTSDFNLDSPSGIAGLKGRVRSAAAELCQTNAVEPVDVRLARIKCFRTAIANGERQVDLIVADQGAPSKMASTMLAGTMR